jgi:hypothetical protein
MMCDKWLHLLALLLPLLFLGAQTACYAWQRAYAPVYAVAIEGYDPRDIIHGEYLQYRILWDDPHSEKPDGKKYLPQTTRIYLPEGVSRDLQSMLLEKKTAFTARITLMGKKAQTKDLLIDGKPWQEGLAAWRQNPQNSPR